MFHCVSWTRTTVVELEQLCWGMQLLELKEKEAVNASGSSIYKLSKLSLAPYDYVLFKDILSI